MPAVEDPGDFRQVAVQRRLAPGQHDGVELAEVGEGTVVLFEGKLEMPVHVEVVPVKARHAFRVAQVRHPQDQVPGKRVAPLEPLAGEPGPVHGIAFATGPEDGWRRPNAAPAAAASRPPNVAIQ